MKSGGKGSRITQYEGEDRHGITRISFQSEIFEREIILKKEVFSLHERSATENSSCTKDLAKYFINTYSNFVST